MAEDIKSSAQIWGGRLETDNDDSPPEYSHAPQQQQHTSTIESNTHTYTDTNTNTAPIPPLPRRPAPPQSRTPYDPLKRLSNLTTVPFHKYNIPSTTPSPDAGITHTTTQKDLYTYPHQLLSFILDQASLPPKPTLRITGSHSEYASGAAKTDFDITLNLTFLLALHKHRYSFKSAQVSPLQADASSTQTTPTYAHDDPTVRAKLTTGIKLFTKDAAENKSYTLTRTIHGLPTETLAGQVRNLAASVKYRGLIRIDFTTERSKVVVHKQNSGWLSSVLRLYPEKKFEMVEVVWGLADGCGAEEDDDEGSGNGGGGSGGGYDAMGIRAGQEWWRAWESTIRNAIVSKYRGHLGIEDWIETRMGRFVPEPRVDWGNDFP